jgi:hypothetical protein
MQKEFIHPQESWGLNSSGIPQKSKFKVSSESLSYKILQNKLYTTNTIVRGKYFHSKRD